MAVPDIYPKSPTDVAVPAAADDEGSETTEEEGEEEAVVAEEGEESESGSTVTNLDANETFLAEHARKQEELLQEEQRKQEDLLQEEQRKAAATKLAVQVYRRKTVR